MPKIKTFVIYALVVALSALLFGCSLVSALVSQPETVEIASQEGDLPTWLLLSHRSIEGPGTDKELLARNDDDDEDEPEANDTGTGGTTAPAGGAEEYDPAPAQAAAPKDSDDAIAPSSRSGAFESIAYRRSLRESTSSKDEDKKDSSDAPKQWFDLNMDAAAPSWLEFDDTGDADWIHMKDD